MATRWGIAARAWEAVAAVLLLCAPSSHAEAQREHYGPLVLQLPAGVRQTTLGGAPVAVRDMDAVFANPALVGVVSGTSVSLARFSGHAAMGTMASSASVGVFNVGVGVQFADFEVGGPQVPLTSRVLTSGGPDAGSSLAGTFAMNMVWRGLRVGAAAKYVEDRLSTRRAGSSAFDLGVATQGQTTWALAVQNIGSAIDLEASRADLPLRVAAGVSRFGLPVGPLDLGASIGVSVLRRGFVAPAAGVEWGYTPLEGYTVAMRVGARRPELREQRPLSAGASFTLDRFTVDYAVEDLAHGAAHRLALRVR